MSKSKPNVSRKVFRDSRINDLVRDVLLRALENVRTGQDLAAGADPWQTASRFRAASQHDFDEKLSRVMITAREVTVRKISM